MSTVFTMPGKMGDALLQWPVVRAWLDQRGQSCELWVDEKTCSGLVELFEAQPGVTGCKTIGGVENYRVGGQPFHMNIDHKQLEGRTVYHLGMRQFPQRQITQQALLDSRCGINDPLRWNPSLEAGGEVGSEDRLVLHGQAMCGHSQATPQFWKFYAGVRETCEEEFASISFVGSPDDLDVAHQFISRLPAESAAKYSLFRDGGSILRCAEHMQNSRAFIGCSSSMAALAGALGVPAIRVHDPIGDHPKAIWSNLGDNQVNDTEVGLRKTFWEWLAQYVLEGEKETT